MSAHDALMWTLTAAIWLVVILPVTVLCGCMVFIVISNHFQSRRLGKMMPGLTPPVWGDTVVELHRPANAKPQMIMIRDPKEPA